MSSTISTAPPPSSSARPPPRRFSPDEYRAFNDALEAKYPEVGVYRDARRLASFRREVREQLRIARRSGLADVRLAALESAVELLIEESESRGAK
jgi:hypothetical protein